MSAAQDASRRNGRRKRVLSAQEKYQIWQQLLTGELTQRQAAEQWNVDPTTIMRIRKVGREGALSALAQSRPGVRAGAGGVQDAELAAARPTAGLRMLVVSPVIGTASGGMSISVSVMGRPPEGHRAVGCLRRSRGR